MDFVTIVIFLALYYVRPQEWFAAFNSIHPIQLLSVLGFLALIQSGTRVRALLKTPLDWLILTYLLWTLICGFQFLTTLNRIQSVFLFYFVAVKALDGSIPRQKRFLGWWCFLILLVTALAIASPLGFDPLDSEKYVLGPMKGRLILNLSVFNNPNALGHGIIPVIPLIYYLFFWRNTFGKPGLLLMLLPFTCIFMTQSKGSYLSAFATILATLTFGRSKIAQFVILILAVSVGFGALYQLPRMHELDRAKSDEAIQGRVAAFTYGLYLMRTHFFGIGFGNFEESFLTQGPTATFTSHRWVTVGQSSRMRTVTYVSHYRKATHCTYNQNGAEFGYFGLYLFIGIMYCALRTLLLVKCANDDEERIRRALFAMVVAYAVSSWMVDFCYRPTFFLLIATISAFHRNLIRKTEEPEEIIEDKTLVPSRPWLRRIPPVSLSGIPGLSSPAPAGVAALPVASPAPTALAHVRTPPVPLQPAVPRFANSSGGKVRSVTARPTIEEVLRKRFIWTRLGIWDFVIIGILTFLAILYWQYLIKTM